MPVEIASGAVGAASAAAVAAVLADAAPLKVLIADDDRVNRRILKAMLVKAGYEVLQAEDGRQAVQLFEEQQPDMVLMDIIMPVMEGYEATRMIKQKSGERFVPVLFLTSLSEENDLARCVQCGGDDFITKPYSQVILKAKIDALNRVRALYAALKAQKDELAYHKERIRQEHEIAKKVFANIVHPGSLNQTNLKFLLSPMALFNGDILLAAAKPSGGMHFLLGDFTGHGLSAAIGAMPVSDIFYDRTANGFSISDIAADINQKLKTVLPTGIYFAACLLDQNLGCNTLLAWNGGMPSAFILSGDGGSIRPVPSSHLPLGILEAEEFDRSLEKFEIAEKEAIYVYSDGVVEARDSSGEMFGQDRFERLLLRLKDPARRFDEVIQELRSFRCDGSQDDDTTLIEITCDPLATSAGKAWEIRQPPREPSAWRLSLELRARSLQLIDPLPLLIQTLMEIQGLYACREELYMVLAELYSNALEHGVLGLDSAIKSTPQGFNDYYVAREEKLAALAGGWIRIDLQHQPQQSGGMLEVRVEDSGPGFKVQEKQVPLDENKARSGRGIALVRYLCREVSYNDSGNGVKAIYTWNDKGVQS